MCERTWVQIPLRANFLSNIYSIYDYLGSIRSGFISYTVHMHIYDKRKKGHNMHPAEVRTLLVLLKPLVIAILSSKLRFILLLYSRLNITVLNIG